MAIKTHSLRRVAALIGASSAVAVALAATGAGASVGSGGFAVKAVHQEDPTILAVAGKIKPTSGGGNGSTPGDGSGGGNPPGGGGEVTPPGDTETTKSGTFAFTIADGCTSLGIYIGDGSGSVELTDPSGVVIDQTAGAPGLYQVANPAAGEWVADGEFEKLGSSGYLPGVQMSCLTSVTKWQADDPSGTFSRDSSYAFNGTQNLQSIPALPPTVRNADYMFTGAFVGSSVNGWDTSRITSMEGMFTSATLDPSLNISEWNTGNVTSMKEMFSFMNFNVDISKWDTSKVETTEAMFLNNRAFNGDISQWKTGNVKNMSAMFFGARVFNKPLNDWDVGKVENFEQTFYNAWAFNQPLNKWTTGNATNMKSMFAQTRAFNQDISMWNTSKADKKDMFLGATAYTYPKP